MIMLFVFTELWWLGWYQDHHLEKKWRETWRNLLRAFWSHRTNDPHNITKRSVGQNRSTKCVFRERSWLQCKNRLPIKQRSRECPDLYWFGKYWTSWTFFIPCFGVKRSKSRVCNLNKVQNMIWYNVIQFGKLFSLALVYPFGVSYSKEDLKISFRWI